MPRLYSLIIEPHGGTCIDPAVGCHPMPETLSAALAPLVLPDTEGGTVRLGSLWERRPAVVVFLRHYG